MNYEGKRVIEYYLRPENLIKRPHNTTIKNKEGLFCFEKIYLKKYHKCKQKKIQFVYKKSH